MSLSLSIVIVNWNTQDLLVRCLEALFRDIREFLLSSVETFVVDNGSSDGSVAKIQQQFPWVNMIQNEENVGFAQANNQAILQSSGEYILLLNSDAELLPGALSVLRTFMDEHLRAGAIGPRLLNKDRTLQPSCHPMLTPEREFWRLTFLDRLLRRATYNMKHWDTERPRPVESIKGACLLVRRKALDEVGLFDESYFMYTEEVDLCYRLTQAGWELWWVPGAQVIHFGGASSRQMAEAMYLQLHRSKIQFYRKFGGTHRAQRFKQILRLAYWPRLVLSSLGAPLSPTLAKRATIYRRLLAELAAM